MSCSDGPNQIHTLRTVWIFLDLRHHLLPSNYKASKVFGNEGLKFWIKSLIVNYFFRTVTTGEGEGRLGIVGAQHQNVFGGRQKKIILTPTRGLVTAKLFGLDYLKLHAITRFLPHFKFKVNQKNVAGLLVLFLVLTALNFFKNTMSSFNRHVQGFKFSGLRYEINFNNRIKWLYTMAIFYWWQ